MNRSEAKQLLATCRKWYASIRPVTVLAIYDASGCDTPAAFIARAETWDTIPPLVRDLHQEQLRLEWSEWVAA